MKIAHSPFVECALYSLPLRACWTKETRFPNEPHPYSPAGIPPVASVPFLCQFPSPSGPESNLDSGLRGACQQLPAFQVCERAVSLGPQPNASSQDLGPGSLPSLCSVPDHGTVVANLAVFSHCISGSFHRYGEHETHRFNLLMQRVQY